MAVLTFLFTLILSPSAQAKGKCTELFASPPRNEYSNFETLMALVRDAHPESVRWLLKNSYQNINEMGTMGLNPLTLAIWDKSLEIVDVLREQPDLKIGVYELHFAYRYGNSTILAHLLRDHRADVNARDTFGNTLLHYAAKDRNVDLVKELLALPQLNGNLLNNRGESALDIARQQGHWELMLLLDRFTR